MSNLELIKLTEGQKNWGGAINANFKMLMDRYKTSVQEYASLHQMLEETDSLSVDADDFVYVSDNGKTYKFSYDNNGWVQVDNDPPIDNEIDWDDVSFVGYQAWFVRTKNYDTLEAHGKTWNTGDLLLMKRTLNGELVMMQWSNIMGGYFVPAIHTIDQDTGKIITTYNKMPSNYLENSVDLLNPAIYWKPTSYNSANSKLKFLPYYINNSGQETLIGNNEKFEEVSITYTTKGSGNEGTLETAEKQITIENVFSNSNSWDREGIGFDVHFYDDNNNILFFPYSYTKENKNLKIIIERGSCDTKIKYRVNVFNKGV